MKKWLKRLAKLVVGIVIVMFLLTEPWSWIFGQRQITVSKETTYFTEPLRPDGLVDFPAIINAKLSADVSHDTNAATLLIQLVPHDKWQPGQLEATCKSLGIETPKEGPTPIVDFDTFFREHIDEFPRCRMCYDDNLSKEANAVYENAIHHPLEYMAFPGFANWIKANDAALKIAVEASRRRDYFEPIILQDDEEPVMLASYPIGSVLRTASMTLVFRASIFAGQGQIEKSVDDLLASDRLSALCERGPSILHSFLANGIACAENDIWPVVAFCGKPTKQQLAKMAADLNAIPHLPNIAKKIDVYERVGCLDGIQKLSLWSARVPDSFGKNGERSSLARFLTDATNNWNAAAREANEWFDQLVTATSEVDVRERAKKILEYDKKVRERLDVIRNRWGIVWYVAPRTVRGRMIGEKVVTDIMFGTLWAAKKQVDLESRREIACLSMALLRYRDEHGQLPDKLDLLVPTFIASIPIDYDSGEPIEYQKVENGFRLSRLGPEWMRKESGHDIEIYRLPKLLEESNMPPPEPEKN